jgi:hypothetical protein
MEGDLVCVQWVNQYDITIKNRKKIYIIITLKITLFSVVGLNNL